MDSKMPPGVSTLSKPQRAAQTHPLRDNPGFYIGRATVSSLTLDIWRGSELGWGLGRIS